jgi:hypothetical protein
MRRFALSLSIVGASVFPPSFASAVDPLFANASPLLE